MNGLGSSLRRWLTGHGRALAHVERARPGLLLQPSPHTSANRYPLMFAYIAEHLRMAPAPTILSYGCSTGEEIWALRRLCPQARVVGVDINPRNLAQARRRLKQQPDPQVQLADIASPVELKGETFDAVLCMAVLRHGDLERWRPQCCASILSFEQAEAFVEQLAALVRPGGWMALGNSHFRFADMAAYSAFTPVWRKPGGVEHLFYGPDNQRLVDGSYADVVFRKERAAS